MRNIVILATSRTRSSLVAAIFKEHGVYVGGTFSTRAGYVSHENSQVKSFLKANYGKLPDVQGTGFYYEPNPNVDLAGFLDRVMPDRQWLFKGAVNYRKIFEPMKPVFVAVTRNLDDSVHSYISKANKAQDPMAQEQRARAIIGKRIEVLCSMENERVDTDEIIAGDFTRIRAALRRAGIEPSDEKIRAAIL